MSIYADMYEEWTPPCPHEEQAAEGWAEWMRTRTRPQNDKENK